MLRPTSYLTVVLNSENANATMASAVKRSFSYLAPTTIGKVNTEAAADECSLILDVRLDGHPFMDANNPEQNNTWETALLPWLLTKLTTLFGTVYEFNNEARRSFVSKLEYKTFTLILEGKSFVFTLEPDCSLRSCQELLGKIRAWLASDEAKGLEITSIAIPALASEAADEENVEPAPVDFTFVACLADGSEHPVKA